MNPVGGTDSTGFEMHKQTLKNCSAKNKNGHLFTLLTVPRVGY